MDKNGKINLIALFLLTGFTAAVAFHYIVGNFLGKSYPFNSFLFFPNNIFGDFSAWIMMVRDVNVYEGRSGILLPFSYMSGTIFSMALTFAGPVASRALFLVSTSFSVFFLNLLNIKDKKVTLPAIEQTFILTFLSYPFIFCWDRGNIEIFVFICIAIFFYFYSKQKILLANIFLACALAMKPFPIILLLIFVCDRRFRDLLSAVLLAIVMNIIGFSLFKGGLIHNVYLWLGNLACYQKNFAYDMTGMGYNDFGNSLFGFFKFFYLMTKARFFLSAINVYSFLMIFIFLIILVCIFYVKAHWKKVCLLFIAMCLLPQVSPDYRLIYFVIPLLLFANMAKGSKFDIIYSLLFGLLFIPKNYSFRWTKIGYNGCVIDPVILIIFIIVIVADEIITRPKALPLPQA